MNKQFTYLNEIAFWLLGKADFIHDEYNLSGSRYSSKTFSVSQTIAIIIAIAIKFKKTIAIYAFRKLNKDISELDKEIYYALIKAGFIENKNFKVSHPNKQSLYKFFTNNSFIRVMGVYSNSNTRVPLKGLSRREVDNFDLVIQWQEEANEFNKPEFQAITFAMGCPKKLIKITTCNPDNIYQYQIEYMNNLAPFNLQIMQTSNEQITSIFDNNKFKLFHYSNWKLNQHHLSLDIINNLNELKVLDPVKAQSWYYGVPSVLQGAIFARYLDQIKTKLDFQVAKITGGLDIGMASSASGHPTAASLWFIGQNNLTRRCHKVSEYYHSNATMAFKDTYQLANDIIAYYLQAAQQYQAMFYGFTCYVDYGAGGLAFIDVLNNQKKQKNLPWLKFVAVDKAIMHLKDSIDWFTTMIIKAKISYDWNRCPQTKRQMALMQWLSKSKLDTANNEPKMLDLHDDTNDSDRYALMADMRWLIADISNPLLINKNKYGEM